MRYHVITPFAREKNFVPMYQHLRPLDVKWHLLIDRDGYFDPSMATDWTRCYQFPPAKPFWRAWANHLNDFIEMDCIQDTDRYQILNDDDFVEPGFYQKLDQHLGEVLICSMKRGQHVPPGGHDHPTDTLIACPQNMRVGRVGCEQLIVSGRLLKDIHFADDMCADGMAIVELSKRHPVEYVPEAFVWFNYLEPGRWSK